MLDIEYVKPLLKPLFPFPGAISPTWLDIELQANRLRNEEDAIACHFIPDVFDQADGLADLIEEVPLPKREEAAVAIEGVLGLLDPLRHYLLKPLATGQLLRCIGFGASYMSYNAARQLLPMLPAARTNLLPSDEKLYYGAILDALLIGHCIDRMMSHLRLVANDESNPATLQSSMDTTQLSFNAAKERMPINHTSFIDTLQLMRRPLTGSEENTVTEFLQQPHRPNLLQTIQRARENSEQPSHMN